MSQKYRYGSSFFLGQTTRGTAMPVFFDPHAAQNNDAPPGTLITGSPGSGKTFLAQTLAAISAISGKTTVILDPKGDFLPLANLSDQIGHPTVWDLSRSIPGLLDPFYMTNDPVEKVTLVMEVIEIFLGSLSPSEQGALFPIVKDVVGERNPSLQLVVDRLLGSPRAEARGLGNRLEVIRNMKFARMCFAPGNNRRAAVSIKEGTTIISMVGLELPVPGSDMGRTQRLSAGIFFLITDFVRRIMEDDTSLNPKLVIVDEAHRIASSEAGGKALKNLLLLGRSRALATLIISQSMAHLSHLEIENTISTRFAFASDPKEASSIVKAMILPENEGFESVVVDLAKREMLMRDFEGRYSVMQVVVPQQDWIEAFNTNPQDRLKKLQQERASEAASRRS